LAAFSVLRVSLLLQAQNPQTRGYLSQPDFVAMMQDMSSNPGNMNKYLGDPRFQAALQVCIHLRVVLCRCA